MRFIKEGLAVKVKKLEYTGFYRHYARYKQVGFNHLRSVTIKMRVCEADARDMEFLAVLSDMLQVPLVHTAGKDDEQSTISLEVVSAVAVRQNEVG